MLLLALAAHDLGGPIRSADAAFPAAELSPNLVFHCQPDQTVSAVLRWESSFQGVQWLDVSLFDNAFAVGTFAGFGPLTAAATAFETPGLAGGAVYYARVNTLTSGGWASSPTLIFATPADCPPSSVPLGLVVGPEHCPIACLWTERPDYDTYFAGELVTYCFFISLPADIRIVATKPDGQVLLVEGFVNGTSGCAGPFQAAEPAGLRTVRLYAGPALILAAETLFYVR
jgi:hypothetical protein